MQAQNFKLNSATLFLVRKVIGAVVFVIGFILFTLISLAVDLPPGIYVHDWFNIAESDYSSLIDAIVNGVVYGIIIWLVFSLAKMAWGRKKKPEKRPLREETLAVKKEPREPKPPKDLTEIKGIGPKRVEELKAAGVTTVSDLAKRSAKNLSEKTGIPIKIISRWIEQANEML